jgi:hypothetical protein
MTKFHHLLRTLAVAATVTLAPLVAGCMIVADDHVEDTGTVTFRWSLEEGYDPRSCAYFRASEISIEVYDRYGNYETAATAPCTYFTRTLTLWSGRYSASLTLLDANGRAVSTRVDTGPFVIDANRGVLIDSDFPGVSFY